MLKWALTDLDQTRLASLEDRRLGRVSITRNGGRSASVALALDDADVNHVEPLTRLLACYLKTSPDDDVPARMIFNGRVSTPQAADQAGAGEGGATMTVEALDPLGGHMQHIYLDHVIFNGVDQSEIMAALLTQAETKGHGVIAGELWTGGADRDRTYFDGKELAEALTQMAEVIGGPDFELAPVAFPGRVIAKLNTFAAQGAIRPAIFEYGFGRHNVAGFTYSPDGEGVINRFTAVSGIPDPVTGGIAAAVADSPGSQEHYGGVFEAFEVISDVSEASTLAEYAEAQVKRYAYAIEYFTLTLPAQQANADGEIVAVGKDKTGNVYGNPPVVGDDWWIADTIGARVRRNLKLDVVGRVEHIELVEDEQGSVVASLTCTPVNVEATDVAVVLTDVVLDTGV